MTEPRIVSGFADSAGERIYYETAGGAGDVVVLCHGLGGSHAVWFQQLPVFAESHRVVVWDQRGFGRSTDRAGDAGPEASARDLEALLDHLGVTRAHVVGQSMGGWAALGFATARPERVRSLVLADTIAGIYTPEIEAHFDTALRRARPESPEEGVPMTRHPALGEAFGRRDPARAYLYRALQSLCEPPPAAIAPRLRATAVGAEALAALRLPVLFVVGSDDGIFPPDAIRRAAALVGGARVAVIPGAGHSPYFEMPEAWNETVLAFLRGGGRSPGE